MCEREESERVREERWRVYIWECVSVCEREESVWEWEGVCERGENVCLREEYVSERSVCEKRERVRGERETVCVRVREGVCEREECVWESENMKGECMWKNSVWESEGDREKVQERVWEGGEREE